MSILGLLNQQATIYPKSSYNSQGRVVTGTGTTVRGRFQAKKATKIGQNSAVIVIEGIFYVANTVTVDVDYKVVFSGNDYKVYSKYAVPDGQGNTHHIKLELTKWQTT